MPATHGGRLMALVCVCVVLLSTAATARKGAHLVTLKGSFIELDQKGFGFLPGGTIDVEIASRPTDVDLWFLVCTSDQMIKINQHYGTVEALCANINKDVPAVLRQHVVNGTYSLSGYEITSRDVYYMLLGNCHADHVSANYWYQLLNPGGEHLPYGLIPTQQLFTAFAVCWAIVLAAWSLPRLYYMRITRIRLYDMMGVVALCKLAWCVVSVSYWRQQSRQGESTSSLNAAYYSVVAAGRASLMVLLLSAANGWCVTCLAMPRSDVQVIVLAAISYALSVVANVAYSGYYQFLVLVVFIIVMRVIFTALNENVRLIRTQLSSISRAGIRLATTPVFRKLQLMLRFQSHVVGYVGALVFFNILSVFFWQHLEWIYMLCAEGADIVLLVALLWLFRLRDFSIYERYYETPEQREQRLRQSSARAAPDTAAIISPITTDALATAAHTAQPAHTHAHAFGSPPVAGTITRSPLAPPAATHTRVPDTAMRDWEPGMALPGTPEYAHHGGPNGEPVPHEYVVIQAPGTTNLGFPRVCVGKLEL